jgi:hypothetical protein
MRYTGFVKEHDAINEALEFNSLFSTGLPLNDKDKIVDFLKRGKVICTWMTGVIDLEGGDEELIHSYLTDGYWIWPSYIIHYFMKYQMFKLDDDFIEYIRKHEYKTKLPKNFNLGGISEDLTRRLSEDN